MFGYIIYLNECWWEGETYMKKNIRYIPVAVLISFFLLSGCAQFGPSFLSPASLAGFNIKDLKRAASENGREKVFSMPYKTAFDKTIALLKAHHLEVYQNSIKNGCIVVVNFEKQVNTTRLGVFFESLDENKTKITLGSLSTGVLKKGEEIIFEELK